MFLQVYPGIGFLRKASFRAFILQKPTLEGFDGYRFICAPDPADIDHSHPAAQDLSDFVAEPVDIDHVTYPKIAMFALFAWRRTGNDRCGSAATRLFRLHRGRFGGWEGYRGNRRIGHANQIALIE